MELEETPPFTIVGNKAEQAILCFVDDSLVVVLVEMKTSLMSKHFKQLVKKMTSSMRAILVWLNLYHWDQLTTVQYIKFYGVVCYNAASSITKQRVEGLREQSPSQYAQPIYELFLSEDDFAPYEIAPYPATVGIPRSS